MTRFIKSATKHTQDKASWIILTVVVGLVVFSNMAYAGRLPIGSTLLNNSNLGGPLDTSLASVGVLQANGILGLPNDEELNSTIQTTDSNIINIVNSPEGYTTQSIPPVVKDYIVQDGDTLESISQKFNISVETIAITNGLKDLKQNPAVNSTLSILPKNGIRTNITESQSLEQIANKYAVSEQNIRDYNNLQGDISNGISIIIPDAQVPNEEKPFPVEPVAKPKPRVLPRKTNVARASNLPNNDGYFAFPTTGNNYGRIHSNNGVDISNSCGTPIYASADGVVTTSQNGWNGGYGNYIKITHPNGVVTLYAHLSSRDLQTGANVTKGQYLGAMGTTGNSTGCHLHFEVRGARNPLAR
ncbi:MAG: peptidoglycan DD-metalloendopeptidase family protein [Candidatus Paceibacterota bacterium]